MQLNRGQYLITYNLFLIYFFGPDHFRYGIQKGSFFLVIGFRDIPYLRGKILYIVEKPLYWNNGGQSKEHPVVNLVLHIKHVLLV